MSQHRKFFLLVAKFQRIYKFFRNSNELPFKYDARGRLPPLTYIGMTLTATFHSVTPLFLTKVTTLAISCKFGQLKALGLGMTH